MRRSARSDHETELAARSPGGADANSSFFCKIKSPQKKLLRKNRPSSGGVPRLAYAALRTSAFPVSRRRFPVLINGRRGLFEQPAHSPGACPADSKPRSRFIYLNSGPKQPPGTPPVLGSVLRLISVAAAPPLAQTRPAPSSRRCPLVFVSASCFEFN